MAHPFAGSRQHLVEKSRVSSMCKGYATGGVVSAPAPAAAPAPVKRATGGAAKIEGRKSGGRLDKFARGGAVKKGSTNVNVIIAPQGGGAAAPPNPPVMAGPPPMPMPPPGMPPGAGPPMPQRHGGRAYATGGGVKAEGMRNGTQVSHSPGKNDTADILRPKQITYARGGKAYPIEDGAGGGAGRLEKIGKRP